MERTFDCFWGDHYSMLLFFVFGVSMKYTKRDPFVWRRTSCQRAPRLVVCWFRAEQMSEDILGFRSFGMSWFHAWVFHPLQTLNRQEDIALHVLSHPIGSWVQLLELCKLSS